MSRFKVLVTTHPFSDQNPEPLALLKQAGVEVILNPLGRKMKEAEVAELAMDVDALIAGTEPLSDILFSKAKKLRLIARVGIGLDGVNLNGAKARGIKVSYTPDAPAPAVAELAVGNMLALLRHVPEANRALHQGEWKRHFGRRIGGLTVGLIGGGRIGGRVAHILNSFGPAKVLMNDQEPAVLKRLQGLVESADRERIYRECDLISLHVPLTMETKDLITTKEIALMKKNVILINTARGGIINEQDLFQALSQKRIQSAAIDVFEQEPYEGNLAQQENCLMTCHMGSMTFDCRAQMEIEATQEVVRYAKNETLRSEVPEFEYVTQAKMR